jgi:hypothetical protein
MCKLRKCGHSANTSRQDGERTVRKSERIRLLEIQVARLEVLLELHGQTISNLVDYQGIQNMESLESGKWYNAKKDQE